LAVPTATFPTVAPGATVTQAPPSYPGTILVTYTTNPTSSNTTPATFTFTA
jgi:hypothetical protein